MAVYNKKYALLKITAKLFRKEEKSKYSMPMHSRSDGQMLIIWNNGAKKIYNYILSKIPKLE